ncbi:MAG: hypothetical protein EOM62_13515 [Bacteroidia bacterium]|nr:hypothetical protein [Bacteroidia bacterium]
MKPFNQKPKNIHPVDAYWIPTPGIKGFGIKLIRKLKKLYQCWFQNEHYIFMHCGPFDPPVNSHLKFARYDRFDDIPSAVKNAILTHEGIASLDNERFEMKHGATMWVGFVDGQPAHIKFSRYGKDFKRWFIDIDDHDVVIFRDRTYPEFRGFGAQGDVSKQIMFTLLQNRGKAYCDCSIHNLSSMRGLKKAGFVIIRTKKPITRKQALGVDQP